MGRHRRTAGRGTAQTPTATAIAPSLRRPRRGAHRDRRHRSGYVRTGLVGASAAVAMGVVAVTTGVLPGGGSYSVGGDDGSDEVRAAGTPSDPQTFGGTRGPAETGTSHPDRGTASGGPGDGRPASGSEGGPSSSVRPSTAAPHAPEASRSAREDTKDRTSAAPKTTTAETPSAPTSQQDTAEQAAARAVLALVNQARDEAGCAPLRSDKALADLASAFSTQMAEEGFFDHTDPQGRSPWDRAKQAGIDNLGGENIARGQATAAEVMKSWMASPGHRANILNCDYRTIGVGVHFGPGGPWWTQDFGF